MLSDAEVEYTRWQNRAFRFYVPARVLVLTGSERARFNSAAHFCGQQAIETLLKATAIYFNPRFNPKSARHDWSALISALKPLGHQVSIPEYFHAGQRMQTLTRYPSGLIPVVPQFLGHLDAAFADILEIVPFQRGTELEEALRQTRKGPFRYLALRNERIRDIRAHVMRRPRRGTCPA